MAKEKLERQPELKHVQRVWDKAPHNAFTDLIRFKDRWYCAFREGENHISPDGKLRVIRSEDGQKWESASLITSDTGDLRDAKFSITPDGALMLSGAASQKPKEEGILQSVVWLSTDGTNWSEEYKIGDPNFWLWRTTWHRGVAYSMGYGCRSEKGRLRLYKSTDGKIFQKHADPLPHGGFPTETSILFLEDDTACCLLRRDGEDNSALLGMSQPPYTDWKWNDTGLRAGGPHMIRIPDGRFIAAVRLYDEPRRTSLCRVDPERTTITELMSLPSGGDTSYAGLVWHENMLWVSYYSTHEEKTSIYLAQVKF